MHKNFIKTLLIGSVMLPAFAFAQDAAVTAVPIAAEISVPAVVTSAPVTTTSSADCMKAATSLRDSSITSGREAYNAAVKQAQDTRKQAMLTASTTEDKKLIAKTYKEAIKKAEDGRVSARKAADAKFKEGSLSCKELKKAELAKKEANRKAEAEKKKVERKTEMDKKKTEMKAVSEKKKEEVKAVREETKVKVEGLRAENKAKVESVREENKAKIDAARMDAKKKVEEARKTNTVPPTTGTVTQ